MYGVPFFGQKYTMKNIQTELGKQLTKILNRRGEEFSLVSSGEEYDTLQIEIDDNRVMSFFCHEYPGLAHGVLIVTKTIHKLTDTTSIDSLVLSVNEANLKSTSVTTAVNIHKDDKLFTLDFKTFIHLDKHTKLDRILNGAVDLHLFEVDEIISPFFISIKKEDK